MNMFRNGRLLGRAALLTVAGAVPVLVLSAPAYAATGVAKVGNTLAVNASANRANDITVNRVGANFFVRDNGDTLNAGVGCVPVTPNLVRCAAAGITGIAVTTGNRNDRVVNATGTPSIQNGGAGNDRLTGGPVRDVLNGGVGNDVLLGGGGNDTLLGGGGNDSMVGGFGQDSMLGGTGSDTSASLAVRDGRDRFSGGPGTDTTTYAARSIRVTVTLNGVADDGSAPEFDNNLTDVENAVGGSAADSLTGNAAANNLQGRGGNDRIAGLTGRDLLRGGPGNDAVVGGAGADRLFGEAGNDILNSIDGVRGNDVNNGGANADRCFSDRFDARISC